MPDDGDISFDTRLDSYASFFDHAWAGRFLDITEKSLLKQPGFILCRDWKGVALASRMSWLLVDAMETYQRTIWEHKTPNPKRMMDALVQHVTKETGIRHMAKRKILAAASSLDRQFREEMRKAVPAIDRQTIWEEYLHASKEIPWALWASQWLAYSAIYFSYENFLRTAVSIARQTPDYRAQTKGLHNHLAQIFGNAIADECLYDQPIKIARLARHCLVHNGGLESKELRNEHHSIRLQKGYLQIFPEDLRGLYDRLKTVTLKVAEKALQCSAFRTT